MTRHLGDEWLLPELDDHNRAWFTSGEIVVQVCDDCGATQHPPDDVCSGCQGSQLSPRACGDGGRIESAVVVHHPVHPALADRVPYVVAVVSLDGAPGANAIGNVLGVPPESVAIGQRVRAVFEEVPDPEGGAPLQLPQWELVDPPASR